MSNEVSSRKTQIFSCQQRLHPATWLLCWVAFLILATHFSLLSLVTASIVLWLIAWLARAGPWAAVRRLRWVLASGLAIYAFATPGVPLWPTLGIYSPTMSGLAAGAQQMLRLIVAVVSLALLMTRLGPPGVLTALDWLLTPLQWIGYLPERMIARLWLTLHYIQPARQQSFSELLSELRSPLNQGQAVEVVLERQSVGWRDWILLALAVAALLMIRL